MKYQKSDRNDFSDLSQRISRCPDAGKAVDDLKNDGSQKDHAKRNQQQADEDIRCKNIMRESQRICTGIENAGEKKQNGKCADENQRLFFGSFFLRRMGCPIQQAEKISIQSGSDSFQHIEIRI